MRTQQPPTIHSAFNPVVVKYVTSLVRVGETATITIGGQTIPLRAEYYNNEAEIDISQFCQSAFSDGRTAFQDSYYLFIDNRLCAKYTYTDDYGTFDGIAVNSAAQWGESIDLSETLYSFRTAFKRLYQYHDYELTATTFSYGSIYAKTDKLTLGQLGFQEEKNLYTLLIPNDSNFIMLQEGRADKTLTTIESERITDSNGDPIFIFNEEDKYCIMPIIQKPTPQHPFYVRWVNRFGGYDYWMMESVQYTTLSAKMGDSIEMYYTDTQTMYGGNKRTLSKEATKTIKVSTGQCGIDDLNELRYLALSPLVEWYDEKRGVWVNLQCTDSEVETHSCQVGGSIEFEFELPTPRLQF